MQKIRACRCNEIQKILYFCARLLHSRIIIETKSCEQRVFV
jgi:hypothetical protein